MDSRGTSIRVDDEPATDVIKQAREPIRCRDHHGCERRQPDPFQRHGIRPLRRRPEAFLGEIVIQNKKRRVKEYPGNAE